MGGRLGTQHSQSGRGRCSIVPLASFRSSGMTGCFGKKLTKLGPPKPGQSSLRSVFMSSAEGTGSSMLLCSLSHGGIPNECAGDAKRGRTDQIAIASVETMQDGGNIV